MHFIKNNGKRIYISQEATELDSAITSVILNTENIVYGTPVDFIVSDHVAEGSLNLKTWSAFKVLCGPDALADGIPQVPTLRILDHTYISDWDEAVNGVIPDVLPEYADSTAALSGGLLNGQFFRTGDFVKQVHTDL